MSSLWERIRNLFSRKDKQKNNGEQTEAPKSTETPKNSGCKRAPHPYEQVDVDESGAEVKSEPNEFQKPKPKALRQYEVVDVEPGEGGGGVAVH